MDERRQSSLDGTHARPAWRIEPMSSAVLVTVGTEIDLAAVPLFTQVLDAAAAFGLPVILNCADLRYLDSTGMDVLLRYRTRVPRVAIASPQNVIRKIFGVLSLDEVIPIYDTVDTAIEACRDGEGIVGAPAPHGPADAGTGSSPTG